MLAHCTQNYSVARLTSVVSLPSNTDELISLSITDDEVSLVAPSSQIDQYSSEVLSREDDWQVFKVNQQLEFSLVGIIHQLSAALAKRNISTFVLSTFLTDYLLVKQDRIEDAILAFETLGCKIASSATLPKIEQR